MRLRNNQSAFTLVELLLAMAFFSFILVFFTFGFIQINRTFQKGATIKRVTETGRVVIEDVARNVRLSSPLEFEIMRKGTDSNGDGVVEDINRLCLSNGTRYGWNTVGDATQEQASGEDFTLVKSRTGTCGAPFATTAGLVAATEDGGGETLGALSLIEKGITIRNFVVPIEPSTNFNGLRLDITLGTTGAEDLITNNVCDGFAKPGDQFCDTVRFATSVTFRAADL